MKLIRQTFLLGVVLLLSVTSAMAVHIKGGWMYYEVTSTTANQTTYRIVVKVYRDCATPNPGQNDLAINVTIFKNGTNEVMSVVNAPQSRSYTLQKQDFNLCLNPKPFVCYVVLEYIGTVTLPNIPEGYTAAFQRCCRIDNIVNVTQPSNNFGNTYTLTIPGTNLGASFPQNNSPKFVEKDTVAICYNSPFQLDYGATDPDGDSLAYSFTSALNGGSAQNPVPTQAANPPYLPIVYGAAYSSANPFGSNVTINSKTGLISGTSPGVTGEYVLAVLIDEYRNGVKIAQTRKELHVNVAPCSLISATLPSQIISCDDYTVQFQNFSTSPAINSYYWDFGDTRISTDTSTLPAPSYTYGDTGVFKAKLIVNRNANCTDSAITLVRVFPGFQADFEVVGSCVSNPFQFTNTSTTKYGFVNSFRWNFGVPADADDSSIVANPAHKFGTSGRYQVQLIATSSKGCIDTVMKVVDVLDKPLLVIPSTDTLMCINDSIQLSAQGTGNFSWSPAGNIINANTNTPTVFPTTSTTYTVQLNDQGCVNTATVTVNVLSFITVNAGNDTTICRTDGIQLRPVSQGVSYTWSPPAGLSDTNVKNPVATPVAASTTYTVLAKLGKCLASDDITIRTVPYPIVNAGPDTSICFGDTALLTGFTDGSAFTWTPGTSLSNPASLTTFAYPSQTTNYVLRATNNLGCPKPAYDTVNVRVIPLIQVFAGRDTNIVVGQPLQLNATANSANYTWEPSFGLSDPHILNPTLTIPPNSLPDSDEFLKYVLTVSTPEGCLSSDDIIIRVFRTEPSIFIPNAFTPNGDGNNDVFKPVLAGMKQLIYFRIFNRYGQLIFETKQPGFGWDGRVKGELQSSNAFVYDCQAIDYTGKLVKLKGSFVLIR